jgi:hypothetical protein
MSFLLLAAITRVDASFMLMQGITQDPRAGMSGPRRVLQQQRVQSPPSLLEQVGALAITAMVGAARLGAALAPQQQQQQQQIAAPLPPASSAAGPSNSSSNATGALKVVKADGGGGGSGGGGAPYTVTTSGGGGADGGSGGIQISIATPVSVVNPINVSTPVEVLRARFCLFLCAVFGGLLALLLNKMHQQFLLPLNLPKIKNTAIVDTSRSTRRRRWRRRGGLARTGAGGGGPAAARRDCARALAWLTHGRGGGSSHTTAPIDATLYDNDFTRTVCKKNVFLFFWLEYYDTLTDGKTIQKKVVTTETNDEAAAAAAAVAQGGVAAAVAAAAAATRRITRARRRPRRALHFAAAA